MASPSNTDFINASNYVYLQTEVAGFVETAFRFR
jgi:hypothetical protein